MALIPISLRNVPRSPFKNRAFTDITGDFVPSCFLASQTDPKTGRVNSVSSFDLGERDIFPSYPLNLLRKGPNYGKTP